MPWEPEMDTALRLAWLVAGLFFLLFLVSLIGEILGWWDLVGEIGIGVGAIVSILVALVALLAGAGRKQVDEVGDRVGSVGEDVRTVGEDVQSVGEEVQAVGQQVRGVRYAVLANGVKLDELELIQAELDAQTGVLGEQLAVLSEIRDGL